MAYLVIIVLIVILVMNANMTFGHGMGDIYYLGFILFIGIIASLIWFIILKKNFSKIANAIFYCFLVVELILIIIKLTILRGAEYPWNGNLFL